MSRKDTHRDRIPPTEQIPDYVLENIVNAVYPPKELTFLNEEALARIQNTNSYYNYYDLEGQYWTPPGKLTYKPTIMPVNLSRWFVRKRASWMFESAPDIECPPLGVDPPDIMAQADYQKSPKQIEADNKSRSKEDILHEIFSSNRLDEKLLEAGKDQLIGGTVALRIHHDPKRGIKILFKPVQEVFPIPNPEDPDEFSKVHFCSFWDNDKTIWKQTWEMKEGQCYLTEGLYNARLDPQKMIWDSEPTYLDFIPVILIPNEKVAGNIFGTSMLKDLIPLFDQYNRLMSDASDALRFNMFAITVMLNAAPDSEKRLRVEPHAIWNVQGDESIEVKKLEAGFQYSSALAEFLSRLDNVMHLIADVPDITPDNIKGFGLVSGVALKLLYSNLVSATQQSWRVWKSRLMQMNEYIFRMLETYENHDGFFYKGLDLSVIDSHTTRIIPHLPLPENEAEKVNIEVTKLASSLQSVRGALYEIGEKNPERKIAEIIGDRDKLVGDGFGVQLDQAEKKIIGGL